MYYNDTIDDGIYIVDVSGVAPRNEAMALKGIILRMVCSSTIWKLEFWQPCGHQVGKLLPSLLPPATYEAHKVVFRPTKC